MTGGLVTRSLLLDDISIRADGTGRTVLGYCAVWDTPALIDDRDGRYIETLDPHSFDKTIRERAGQISVFYSHGKTLHGTPSERFSLPIGVPEEIRPDGRGLYTATRFTRGSALADEVLAGVSEGAIKGMSFGGRFTRSDRTRGRGGELDHIRRQEVHLREYSFTVSPAYPEAQISGVRGTGSGPFPNPSPSERRRRLLDLMRAQ